MYPDLIRIGGLQITSFGVMMALAFWASGAVLGRELRRLGEDPEMAWDLVVRGALGGIVGAKLYYLLLHWPETVRDPGAAITSRGGLVWYGGFIVAAALVAWRIHQIRRPIGRFGDAIAPALVLAYAIGRLGCFLVGDDYGRPTDLPWAVAFPRGAPPSTAGNLRADFGVDIPPSVPDSAVLAVHPTQLYEVVMALLIFALLWRLRHRGLPAGSLFALYLVLAGAERFIVEIFRAKDDRVVGLLSIAQILSLLLMLLGATALAHLRRASPKLSAA